jgi:hypothetical protein
LKSSWALPLICKSYFHEQGKDRSATRSYHPTHDGCSEDLCGDG